jgi:hypothetical protein
MFEHEEETIVSATEPPTTPAAAAFLRVTDAGAIARLVDDWLVQARGPGLVEMDLRRSNPDFDRSPGAGIFLFAVNDLLRFVGNHVVHRALLRRRMKAGARDIGLIAKDARRLVDAFFIAYDAAARFSSGYEHQRAIIARELGL